MFKGKEGSGKIAVFGAAGHTGRFVVAELEKRGLGPIRIGRDLDKLKAADSSGRHGHARLARAEDPASLDSALEGAALIVNCAGPFIDTAIPLVDAALRAGIPYMDVAPEQGVVRSVFAERQAAAASAGVPVLPGAAFYGGLADLLASALVEDGEPVDSIAVGVGLDSWHPTLGTRLTGARNTAPRLIRRGGRFELRETPPPAGRWDFPEPIGRRDMTMMPLSETITLASHLDADTIESWMNVEALRDIEDDATPPPEPSDESGRSPQRFVMDVVVDAGGEQRRASASGRDIYHVTAPIVVEAAQRLLSGNTKLGGGVHALGAMFDARSFLQSLAGGVADFKVDYDKLHHPLLEREPDHAH